MAEPGCSSNGSMPGREQFPAKRRPRKKVSLRKRVKRPKVRGRYTPNDACSNPIGIVDPDIADCIFSDDEMTADYLYGQLPIVSPGGTMETELPSVSPDCSLSSSTSSAVDSSSSLSTGSMSESITTSQESDGSGPASVLNSEPTPVALASSVLPTTDLPPSQLFIDQGLIKFKNMLSQCWTAVADETGFSLLFIPSNSPKCIRREIRLLFNGEESIFVHCVSLPFTNDVLDLVSSVKIKFEGDHIEAFCKRGVEIAKVLMRYDVCVGANNEDMKNAWNSMSDSYIDTNPFREQQYNQTCRSLACSRLVELGKAKRCHACAKLAKALASRSKFLLSESVSPSTPNVYLTPAQALHKLQNQHEDIRKKDKKISYLQKRIQDVLELQGVDVEEEMHADLSSILGSAKLTPVQKMFLKEQLSCSQKEDSRSHRWHPSLIRLALHLHMVSPACYEALKDSGVVRLPSSRTLFDYSRAIEPREGVSEELVKIAHDEFEKSEDAFKKYCAVLCDEIYVSQNLVYKQSDGSIVGYTHLDEVDREIIKFENYLCGKSEVVAPDVANKVLAYMVKGLTNSVKIVVASFPCSQLTKDMLYARSWQVISELERANIKVLAFVCDGSSVNRAFINMHSPFTKTTSGIIFDTLNFCSPELRLLFFISDVAHLLKTIRNCFYNSGDLEKRPRCLIINGEKVVWKTIIRLYLKFNRDNFRSTYKLNSQNVFPNSYSCMKVKYAAQVMSATIARDIELQKWPHTKETVKFIRKVDTFFDILNGAFCSQGGRKNNKNLHPYRSVDDPRFTWLEEFLVYLDTWKEQSMKLPLSALDKAKTMLSRQTLEGIEISIKGFTGAVRFLLQPDNGAQYIVPRAFSQDHLEQEFSRWRAGGGGNRNPNVSLVLGKQVSLAVQRGLGVRRRKGNVEDTCTGGMELTEDVLPKRPRKPNKRCM